MDISISACLLPRKIKSDATIPIYLRITKNRKSRYVSVGLSVKESEWNKKAKEVRKNHRNCKQYNQIIDEKIHELEQYYLANESKQLLTTKELKDSITGRYQVSVLKIFDDFINKMLTDRRYHENKKAKNVRVNLEAYLKTFKNDLTVHDIDGAFVDGFQNYLIKKVGNGENTVSRKMSLFAGFIRDLRMNGTIITNPYEFVNIVSGRASSKTKLTPEQIEAITQLNLPTNGTLWHTRNYFMYSFYNAGIRFGDICCLTWDNIVDGRLVYKMNKTSGTKSIKQMPYHLEILNHYKNKNSKPSDYIFPILKIKHTDGFELRREISSRNVVINKNLKKIAKMANVESNLSFHVSRHSFSQYALKKGLDIYTISKALGHTDIKVTQAYLSDFDEELVDKSMEKLFG
jgi:site-specific recombinase XerD